jgi:GR25 family glycosyltransferase involved in LPS biosynthesis
MYINLDNRNDRKISILKEFKKIDIPSTLIHRINATLNEICGHLGCTNSHIEALEYAKSKKWRRFIIFEDDAMFAYSKERILYYIYTFLKKYKNDWDVFMLSTYYTEYKDTKKDFIKKLIWGTTLTGYIVNNNYIDKLLANFKKSRYLLYKQVKKFIISNPGEKLKETQYALDQYNRKIQMKDRWYLSYPYLCNQNYDLYSSTMA